MSTPIRFCLVLHNHQPIGNFEDVFEQAYQDSYLPFLDVFEAYSDLKISLHTSGPLAEWLDARHPDYLDRLASLVSQGRVEILGGAFYEPVLTMIPSRDRVGQIESYTAWLKDRLGADVRGMWIPERVWEQCLAADLRAAGIGYSILDDFHFRCAGLVPEQLHGYYVTEDNGQTLSIFPGSEQLRYLIPFRDPGDTIALLRETARRQPNAVAVFGDDGEKFGSWPKTRRHCYEDGWLRRFFDALSANRDWVQTTTLADAIDNVPPLGRVYLSDCSYREMTEWALPVPRQEAHEDLVHALERDSRWSHVRELLRGGNWRNFRVKYPEANEMYSRMMMVSRRLDRAMQRGLDGDELREAQRELYRGQCNCSYWHGAFGGIYLPHLRNAVYRHLIAADNHLQGLLGERAGGVEAEVDDYNFDACREIALVNDELLALVAPAAGGMIYELDVRSICHNLLATMARRGEAYHRRVRSGPSAAGDGCSSIHDGLVFKHSGLEQRLQYDAHPRKSLIDHFYDLDTTLHAVSRGDAMERGDFAGGLYEAKLRRNPDRIQVLLSRQGNAWGVPLTVTKGVTLEAGSSTLEIAYRIDGIPPNAEFHFGVEFNFAGMPAGADDRYFLDADERRLGQLGSCLDLHQQHGLGLADQWLGLQVKLAANRPASFWTYPVETVSMSEGGVELVHQSVVVVPHWWVRGDAEGRWSVVMTLQIDTSLARARREEAAQIAAVT